MDIHDDKFAQLPPPSLVSNPSDSDPTAIAFTFAANLHHIEAPHQFVIYFFSTCGPEEDEFKYPVLETVRMEYFCINGLELDLQVLAEASRRIKLAFGTSSFGIAGGTITIALKFDYHFHGVTPSMCKGVLEDVDAQDAAVLGDVEKVRVALPGRRQEILNGVYDENVLGCMTIFSGAKHLTLMSRERTKVSGELGSLHFKVFKARNPALERVCVVDGG